LSVKRFLARSLSTTGMIFGMLFFAASLTPSLVPRTALTQGILAGSCFAIAYGLGVFLRWLWAYLELPEPKGRAAHALKVLAAMLCIAVAAFFLWRAGEWQNSVRSLMGMDPVMESRPILICLAALATFIAVLIAARLFWWASACLAHRFGRYIPRRVATVSGVTVVVVLFWLVANGVFVRVAFDAVNLSFQARDALIEPERPKPQDPVQTGSTASLVAWNSLGRAGREFIATRRTAAEISAFTHCPAMEPIRVYVGLNAAENAAARARLALEELKRVGAFDRSMLVVVTPTGTGWVDPSAMNSIEYLQRGDIASVAIQYSYLSSPLSLLAHPEYGYDAARLLFHEVYSYWTTLPKDKRPKLYLHGLSLGAMNSERSVELFDTIGDPINGALWSGPPFGASLWRSLTNRRNPGSPAWLPEFRDGRFARFLNQDGSRVPADAPWGPTRIVYLQYASDAVTFFDIHDVYRQPAWMDEPRGPDVSPQLRWYPIVTALQLALDMAVATAPPIGYGHVYAPEHYVVAWQAVTGISDWSDDALAALKVHLAAMVAGRDDGYEGRGG
jgi:uncharacterized membrane protein